MSIVQGFAADDHTFFILTLGSGLMTTVLFVMIVWQLIKIPTNDFFVLKGSIYLLLAFAVRAGACFWLFAVWMNVTLQN